MTKSNVPDLARSDWKDWVKTLSIPLILAPYRILDAGGTTVLKTEQCSKYN